MSLLRHLPNLLTCANLVCGCVGIRFAVTGELAYAAYAVWAACAFDFFDGFAARILKTSSPIGKELDSLADMVSFGVLPSMVMFFLIGRATTNSYLPYVSFIIAAFSALRLAKFNIDDRQTNGFIGLPTPANALFLTSICFLRPPFDMILTSTPALIVVTLVLAGLLVSPLPLFALKFKTWSWSENKLKFTFIILSVLLIGWLHAAAIPFVILSYIVVALFQSRFSRH